MVTNSEYAAFVQQMSNPELTPPELKKNFTMGLSGEAGEVTELIKKFFYHNKLYHLNDMTEELGGTLFYLVGLCNLHGITLEDVMEFNMNQLKERHPNGKFETGY